MFKCECAFLFENKSHYSLMCQSGSGMQLTGIYIKFMQKVDSCHFSFNPLTAKLFNLNFHSLEVVSR